MKLTELKTAYEAAVANGQTEFTITLPASEGGQTFDVFTGYAKYLIERLESAGATDVILKARS